MFELNINTIAFLLISFVLLAHYNLKNEIELFYIMALYLVLGNLSSQIITYMLFILQSSEKSVILFLLKNSLLVYILTRIAIIFIFGIVSKLGIKDIFNIKLNNIEIFSILFISSTLLFICIILSKILYGQWILSKDILMLDIILFSLSILVIILYRYFIISKSKIRDNETEMIILENRLELQKNIIDLNDEYLHFKHDLKHTFRYIESLLDAGDISAAKSTIKNQLDLSVLNTTLITTQCPIFDLIINDYRSKAINQKIDMKVLANITSDINVNVLSFNSLLCNCLDNAFENTGCNGMVEVSAEINIDFVEITVFNTINRSISYTKDSKYHGKGLTNIRRYVKDFGGIINLIIDDNAEITIKFPNSITPK